MPTPMYNTLSPFFTHLHHKHFIISHTSALSLTTTTIPRINLAALIHKSIQRCFVSFSHTSTIPSNAPLCLRSKYNWTRTANCGSTILWWWPSHVLIVRGDVMTYVKSPDICSSYARVVLLNQYPQQQIQISDTSQRVRITVMTTLPGDLFISYCGPC